MLARLPDHTPEIMMSLSQRSHVLADPIAALITELRPITIQETADLGRTSSVRRDNTRVVNLYQWLNTTQQRNKINPTCH